MFDKAEFINSEFPIQKGDLLVLYSDGLIETRDEQIIKNTLPSNGTPKELATKIMEAATSNGVTGK